MVSRLGQWLSAQQEKRREARDRITENIARRLSQNRIARGRESDDETDRRQAERIVRNPFTRTIFRLGSSWRNSIEAVESTWVEAALEGLVNDLQNLAIIDLLNLIASLSLISTAIGFFSEAGERKKQNHYQAWQVINLAIGSPAESGRKAAIADLFADGVSLAGLDLNKATIQELDISPDCLFLSWHVFHQLCTSKVPMFSERIAFLPLSNFRDAILLDSNFSKANLVESNFENVNLVDNQFQEARLYRSKFQYAVIVASHFQNAHIVEGSLQNARFIGGSLQGANLSETKLERALFIDTDLRGVQGLVKEQLTGENSPLICNTTLPEELAIDPNRDCDRLAEMSLKYFPQQENGEGLATVEEAEKQLQTLRQLARSSEQQN